MAQRTQAFNAPGGRRRLTKADIKTGVSTILNGNNPGSHPQRP
jgi:hypothetical protein